MQVLRSCLGPLVQSRSWAQRHYWPLITLNVCIDQSREYNDKGHIRSCGSGISILLTFNNKKGSMADSMMWDEIQGILEWITWRSINHEYVAEVWRWLIWCLFSFQPKIEILLNKLTNNTRDSAEIIRRVCLKLNQSFWVFACKNQSSFRLALAGAKIWEYIQDEMLELYRWQI